MIELKRLRLVNWHNFENVTFDCAKLTYMIGVNAVGKTTILDAIRYCLTTNRSFNALGNKKSGRTLQGSVHAKQRGENAYRRPGHTVAYIGTEFWDDVQRCSFVIAVRVESESPGQDLRPGDQTWYLSEPGCTLDQLPLVDERAVPTARDAFTPESGRLYYTRSPAEARDRICRALGIGRASSPLGKRFGAVFQMGTSMDEIPNFREFLYQYILPQPEVDLDALQSDRVELDHLHGVLAQAQSRASALKQIVELGSQAEQRQAEAEANRGLVLLGEAAAARTEAENWRHKAAEAAARREGLEEEYAARKQEEQTARQAYLAAHSAAAASDPGRDLAALGEALGRKKTALEEAERKAGQLSRTEGKIEGLLNALTAAGLGLDKALSPAAIQQAETEAQPGLLTRLAQALRQQEGPLEEGYFSARQAAAGLETRRSELEAQRQALAVGRWVYPNGDCATRVRDAVNAELSARGMSPEAKILCELLRVEDESWQDCVEACLGGRRFDILVPARQYAAAKDAFVALGEKAGPVALLDSPALEAAAARTELPEAGTLARQVSSENPLARQYAWAQLHKIRCCESAAELERWPESATRDLLRHHPYRLERLRRPQRFIGLDARKAAAEALAGQLEELAARRAAAREAEQQAKALYDRYQKVVRGGEVERLSALWQARQARDTAREEYAALAARQAECAENPLLQGLYREQDLCEEAWEAAQAAVEKLAGEIRVCQEHQRGCEEKLAAAEAGARRSEEGCTEYFAAHPEAEPQARERWQLLKDHDAPEAALEAARTAQNRLEEGLRRQVAAQLEPAQREYNARYVCDYALGLAGLADYRRQYQSLVQIDLERYAAQLEQAQRDCKARFRKDILFRLKDDIFNARRQFKELNRVMERLCYGEEVYRFELEPSRDPQLAAFYQLIVDKGNRQMTGEDSLDNLAATADPVYERQVDALMEKIMADLDAAAEARQSGQKPAGAGLSDYVDYRTYLDYDIQVTNRISGQKALLSRVSRDSSGGENQAPFYVAICASLLQIYQKSENSIRLVLLDEAFSKMTSDRIRPMMELFRRLRLQVVLISTVEKSTAIQPYCDITYSIVRHGDSNAIAPFYRLPPQQEGE